MPEGSITSVWRPGRPVDLRRTLGPLMRGTGDPAHQIDAAGGWWWAARTPFGPGTLWLRVDAGEVTCSAWGPGADWLVGQVPCLLGASDDWSELDLSAVPWLARVLRSCPGLRLPATGLVLDSLVPAVLEQRVTGGEARRAWRILLRRYGEPAPGPRAGMMVAPTARALLDLPSWEWHRLGVDLQRHRSVRAAATVADRLEECCGMALDPAAARLRLIPGVGVWTVAETLQRAMGHPDAVSVGDFHIHDLVVHALSGRPRGDDAEMLRLLAPWQGQRQRVVRLIELSPVRKPRFAPRFAPNDIRAI